jgi:RHS repeat-associated protein
VIIGLMAAVLMTNEVLGIGFRPALEVKAVYTNDVKCAFQEYTNAAQPFTNATPPLIRGYRKQTTQIIRSYDYTFEGSAGCSPGWLIIDSGPYSIEGTLEEDLTRVEYKTVTNGMCQYTNYYLGSNLTTLYKTDERTWQNTNPYGGCSPNFYQTFRTVYEENMQIPQLGLWENELKWLIVTTSTAEGMWSGNGCDNQPPGPNNPIDALTISTNLLDLTPDLADAISPTQKYLDLSATNYIGLDCWEEGAEYELEGELTAELEDEFTTEELMGLVRSNLPPYGTWISYGADGPVSAWRFTDCTEWEGYEGKARLRVSFQTKRGYPYILKYRELRATWKFVDSCTNMIWSTNIVVHRHAFAGTGGTIQVELPELKIETWNNTKVASLFWVFTPRRGLPNGTTGYDEDYPAYGNPPMGWDEFDDDDVPDDNGGGDGEGDGDGDEGPPSSPGGGGGGGEDDCDSCSDGSCNNGFGASATGTQGSAATVSFALGAAENGESAGQLRLTSIHGEDSGSPAALKLTSYREDVEVVLNEGVVRQVNAPQGLVDIVTNNASQYQINYYPPAQVGAKVSGVYITSGTPMVTHTVSALGDPTLRTNLTIVTTKGGSSITNRISTTRSGWEMGGGDFWTAVSSHNGLRTNRVSTTWDGSVSPPARIVRSERYDPGTGDLLHSSLVRYEQDAAGHDVVVLRQFSVPGETRELTREYYPDSTPPGFAGRLKKRIDFNGAWSYYEYDPNGRVAREFIGFLNQGYTTDSNLCRSITKDYTMLPPEWSDPYSYDDLTTPRMEVEYLLGKEIRRTYRVELEYESRVIVCQTPGADWDAADNLVTITKLYSSGSWENELASVENPDGTMSFYSYATNSTGFHTNTVSSGLPNGGKSDITKGTRTTTVIDPAGQTLSVTTVDVASNLTTDHTISSNPDSVGRYQKVTYMDNTFVWTSYGCCGIETVTNRDGSVTSYDYDALGRKFMQSTDGITKFNYYDTAGRLYSAIRQGTNGNQITLFTRGFDAWGRVIHQTNAMSHVTSWAYLTNAATGGNFVIQTNADGGTIIQTYAIDGTLLKTTGTGIHPARTDYGVEQDGGVWRAYTKEIKLDAVFADTGEWVKSYADHVGRSYKTVYPDGATNMSYFNAQGELWKQVDPDGVITLMTNVNFNESYSVVDMDRDSLIDWSGPDRISKSVNDVTSSSLMGGNVRRTRSYVYASNGSSAETLVGTSEASVDSLKQWSVANGVTNKSQTVYAAGGNRYVTNTAPDGSYTVSVSQKGRQLSLMQRDALNNQLSATTYGHDAHGRMNTVTDARNGTTTFTFNNGDQIVTATTPVPGTGQSAQVTTSYYDNMGRVWRTLQPDNTSVTNEFYLTGELKRNFGARVYPTGFGYDAQGRMTTMTNWSGFPLTGARVTTWNYDSQRAWLNNKRYPDNTGPDYTYQPSGRLASRTWARGVVTTYSYNNAGEQSLIDYADSTADVSFSYDRLGRMTNVVNGAMTTTVYFNILNQFLGEWYSGGVLGGLSVTNGYDSLLRRATNGALNGATWLTQSRFGYDAASRLKTVSEGTNTVAYSYLANSPLVENVWFTNGSALRMATTKQYDYLNRLKQISSVPSAASAVTFNYAYNAANQRTAITNADNSRWAYQYDSLGQVTSGKKVWSDGPPVAGQQFEYGFDDIGNRNTTASGGDQFGNNLRYAGYTNNTLNQITGRSVPGYVNVIGSATNIATVTVNNQATHRRSNYFRVELTATNTSAPVWMAMTNLAVLNNGTNADIVSSVTGNLYVAKSPEIYTYDLDGNLTSDGRWTNRWDAENRLIEMEALSSVPSDARKKMSFSYDYLGRRIQKAVAVWNGSDYVTQSTNKFVYDGWNLIAELNHTNGIVRTYLWGLHLSGGVQGASGAGGLLAAYDTKLGSTSFATYDGNGNLSALASATNGMVTANYEYGPFGEVVRASGLSAFSNPFRFATKYQDDESGLSYYGYRYYDSLMGRWISRDPIGESGGVNHYVFIHNDGPNRVDMLGLADWEKFDIVSKSYINGVSRLGRLPPRSAHLPLEKLLTLASGNPFVSALIDAIAGQVFADANMRLGVLAQLVGGLDAFNEIAPNDSKDGRYRLYGRVCMEIKCVRGKPRFRNVSSDKEGGNELPGIDGTIGMHGPIIQSGRKSLTIWYESAGRPNLLVEPGMQWVKYRTGTTIWNLPEVTVTCSEDNKPKYSLSSFKGSKFPSRVVWLNGEEKRRIGQGAFADLWTPYGPSKPGYVK